MSNGLKKKNHYIPQMILKHFTNQNEQIYEFQKSKKYWHLPNGDKTDGGMTTAGVAKENYLYIQKDIDGILNHKIEDWFCDLETITTPIIQKLIDYKTTYFFNTIEDVINEQDYNLLLFFIIMGYVRTPKHLNSITAMSAGVILELANTHRLYSLNIPEDIKDIDPRDGSIGVTLNNQFILGQMFNVNYINTLYHLLFDYKWILIDNKTKFNLLINDSFINMRTPGFGNPNRLYIPIGKNRILIGDNTIPLDYDYSEMLNSQIKSGSKKELVIKECNFYTITNCNESIYSSSRAENITNYILKNINNNKSQVVSGIGNKVYSPNYIRKNVTYHKKSNIK